MVARWAHNPKAGGSTPFPAPNKTTRGGRWSAKGLMTVATITYRAHRPRPKGGAVSSRNLHGFPRIFNTEGLPSPRNMTRSREPVKSSGKQ